MSIRRHQERRRLLDMEATTEYLGLSEDTIYRLVAEKKLAPVRVDRRMRFDIRELDDLIEEAKKRNTVSAERTSMLSVTNRDVDRGEYDLEFNLTEGKGWRVLAAAANERELGHE